MLKNSMLPWVSGWISRCAGAGASFRRGGGADERLLSGGARLLGMLAVVLLLEGNGLGQTTELTSVDSAGNQGNGDSLDPSTSGDGRYVAFGSFATDLVPLDTNGQGDVFVHDRQTGATQRVSVASSGGQGNNGSSSPSISENARYVAFDSWASNLVSGDTNGWGDIFVHDRQTGATTRVSVELRREPRQRLRRVLPPSRRTAATWRS